jgi:hypothetical protein
MDHRRTGDRRTAEWIGAYRAWLDGEDGMIERRSNARRSGGDADGGDDFAACFLEWVQVESAPLLDFKRAEQPAQAAPGEVPPAEREQIRESVLLDTLRMETECVHMLREVLDSDSRTPETLQLAMQALRSADELLLEENRAWHALHEKHHWFLQDSATAAWESQLEEDWSEALEHVATDVHELTGRVLALQACRA